MLVLEQEFQSKVDIVSFQEFDVLFLERFGSVE